MFSVVFCFWMSEWNFIERRKYSWCQRPRLPKVRQTLMNLVWDPLCYRVSSSYRTSLPVIVCPTWLYSARSIFTNFVIFARQSKKHQKRHRRQASSINRTSLNVIIALSIENHWLSSMVFKRVDFHTTETNLLFRKHTTTLCTTNPKQTNKHIKQNGNRN